MGRKKNKNSKILKVIYAICVLVVIIAGLYYENGYTDINTFINDMTKNVGDISNIVTTNVKDTLTEENSNNKQTATVKSKPVTGVLEMHTIDVGQRR